MPGCYRSGEALRPVELIDLSLKTPMLDEEINRVLRSKREVFLAQAFDKDFFEATTSTIPGEEPEPLTLEKLNRMLADIGKSPFRPAPSGWSITFTPLFRVGDYEFGAETEAGDPVVETEIKDTSYVTRVKWPTRFRRWLMRKVGA